MAIYEWQLGFDFDSVDDGDGQFYVQNGFVEITPDNQQVLGTPFALMLDDLVSFRVFNLTDGATTSSDFSITGGDCLQEGNCPEQPSSLWQFAAKH